MRILLMALALAAVPQAPVPAPQSDRRADTDAIYSALMFVAPENRDAANPVYVIQAVTHVPSSVAIPGFSVGDCVTVPPDRAASWAEILEEMKAGSIVSETLKPTLKLSKPYMLLSADEVEAFKSGFPQSLEPAPPNPKFKGATDLFRLSVVYFNKSRTLALTGFSSSCGRLCGVGSWAVFEKVNLPNTPWIQREWVRCVVVA